MVVNMNKALGIDVWKCHIKHILLITNSCLGLQMLQGHSVQREFCKFCVNWEKLTTQRSFIKYLNPFFCMLESSVTSQSACMFVVYNPLHPNSLFLIISLTYICWLDYPSGHQNHRISPTLFTPTPYFHKTSSHTK